MTDLNALIEYENWKLRMENLEKKLGECDKNESGKKRE